MTKLGAPRELPSMEQSLPSSWPARASVKALLMTTYIGCGWFLRIAFADSAYLTFVVPVYSSVCLRLPGVTPASHTRAAPQHAPATFYPLLQHRHPYLPPYAQRAPATAFYIHSTRGAFRVAFRRFIYRTTHYRLTRALLHVRCPRRTVSDGNDYALCHRTRGSLVRFVGERDAAARRHTHYTAPTPLPTPAFTTLPPRPRLQRRLPPRADSRHTPPYLHPPPRSPPPPAATYAAWPSPLFT